MKKKILVYTSGLIETKRWDSIVNSINSLDKFECVYRIGDSPECQLQPEHLCYKKLNILPIINEAFCPDQKFYQEVLPVFIDMLSRISFRGMSSNRYVHYRYHEFVDYCVTLAKIYASVIKEHKIDLIILYTIPHRGFDYLLAKTAEYLNIKVVFFFQSLIPNRFFPMTSISEYGEFKFIGKDQSKFELPVKKGAKPTWFYMKKKSFKLNFTFILRDFFVNWKFYAFRIISSINFTNKYYFYRSWYEHLNFMIELIKDWEFKNNKKKYSIDAPNLNREYIYFPLHMQPEQSTSSLCTIYVDQLLALEHLCKIMPKHWVIYVKENPKQNHFMRGNSFFDRLATMPQCKYIANNTDTLQLILNSKFVATISGTAGVEAIINSKPVINFGRSWYKSLPGVFDFSFDLDLEKLIHVKIDQDAIQRSFDELMAYSHKGVLSLYYEDLLTAEEKIHSEETTKNSIKNILFQLFSPDADAIISKKTIRSTH